MPFKPSLIHFVIAALLIFGYAVIAQIEYSPFSPPEKGGDKAMEMLSSVVEPAAGDAAPAPETQANGPETAAPEGEAWTPPVSEDGVIGPLHAIAMHGKAKYGPGFTHFDYTNPNAPKGGEMHISAVGTFDSLNPHILKGAPASGMNYVFETLLESSQDEAFTEYGLLAESFEMPEDRSWVVFNLRPEARWHDGEPVTADDVVWSFNTLLEKGHPFYKAYYANVKAVEKEGDRRVKFIFDMAGNRELPLIMGQMPVFPKHWWTQNNRDFGATLLEKPLGSGPYKVAEFDTGRRIEFERVKDWWGKDLALNTGRYNFDRLVIDYYRDGTVALQAFLAGEYDFRQENTAKDWAIAYDAPALEDGMIVKEEIQHDIPAGMQGFIFNIRRPQFQEKAVREAIIHAFDFEWSNKQFAYGMYKRTDSYFENSELEATGLPTGRELEILEEYRDQLPESVFTEDYEPPRTDGSGRGIRRHLRTAAKLLDDAGWELVDGVRQKDGVKLEFEIVNNNPQFERWIAPFIQNLERIGVKANFHVVDTAQYQNRMDGFDFDMTVGSFGQSLSPGNEQRDFWGSEKADVQGSRNLIGIKDPVVDALIDRIISAPTREELVALTHALDRVLLSGRYLVPNWHIDYFRLAYWNKFARPDVTPRYGMGAIDTWWVDPAKKRKLDAYRNASK